MEIRLATVLAVEISLHRRKRERRAFSNIFFLRAISVESGARRGACFSKHRGTSSCEIHLNIIKPFHHLCLFWRNWIFSLFSSSYEARKNIPVTETTFFLQNVHCTYCFSSILYLNSFGM
jgi:hypothetical protein